MYTQLFGHYLLKNNVVSIEQLQAALEAMSRTKAKLGALAISAGYMTAEQVEKVHFEQTRVDKRIGDIAVEMGFLRPEQINELLSKQKSANVVLGQALIDLGYITTQQFADAVKGFKSISDFSEDDLFDDNITQALASALEIDACKDKDFYTNYILLLTRNCIRFIGDDFAFSDCSINLEKDYSSHCSQEILGKIAAFTAIGSDEKAFSVFASRYAGEELSDPEYIHDGVGEFLNLQNGLYAVNRSHTKDIELGLTPPVYESAAAVKGDLIVTMAFSFGLVDFVISKK
ncbi:MAG: chemotaxis protein CheX [Clostridia bacterium]|nr:chemotaxis protein CheX [Clostridia bacterium]